MGKVDHTQVRPRTLVYVIFKECVTESRGVSQPFIAYEMPDSTSPFDNRVEMQSLDDLLKFFAYEHFTPVYDPANLHGSQPSSPQPEIKTNRPQLFSRRLAFQTKMKKWGLRIFMILNQTPANAHLTIRM